MLTPKNWKTLPLKQPADQKLKLFQRKSVRRILRFFAGDTPTLRKVTNTQSAYLANEMGLGKTPTAVVLANTLDVKKILVVCPALMRLVWRDEILAWSTRFHDKKEVAVLTTKREVKPLLSELPEEFVVIVSYDLATPTKTRITKKGNRVRDLTVRDALEDLVPFDLVIFDEAHALKNRKSKRSQTGYKYYFKNSRYKLLMSGTPTTVHVTDLYAPLSQMLPSVVENFYDFAHTFSNRIPTPWGVKYEGVRNGKVLKKLLKDTVLIRYKKEEVLKELPPKQFMEIPLPESLALKPPTKAQERKQQEDAINKIVHGIESGTEAIYIPDHIATLRKEQALRKVKHVEEFIRSIVAQGEPLVVFYFHTDFWRELDRRTKDLNPQTIRGGTAHKARAYKVKDFQSGETDLLYIQIRAGGLGITLTRSNLVLLAELDWSPSIVAQAIDRVHRITQHRSVMIYTMPVEGSVDRRVEKAVISRAKDFKVIFDK